MIRRLFVSLFVASLFGCANLLGSPVAAANVASLARELGGVVELVAARVLGPKAPEALRAFVEDARRALWAVRRASEGSAVALAPDEARRLFARFLDAYESLWLALEAAGMLGPSGELLPPGGLGEVGSLGSAPLDAGTVPSPAELRERIDRRLGGEP